MTYQSITLIHWYFQVLKHGSYKKSYQEALVWNDIHYHVVTKIENKLSQGNITGHSNMYQLYGDILDWFTVLTKHKIRTSKGSYYSSDVTLREVRFRQTVWLLGNLEHILWPAIKHLNPVRILNIPNHSATISYTQSYLFSSILPLIQLLCVVSNTVKQNTTQAKGIHVNKSEESLCNTSVTLNSSKYILQFCTQPSIWMITVLTH